MPGLDIITINQEIFKKISEMDLIMKNIDNLSEEKANAIGNYEKAVSIALIRLSNGEQLSLDGKTIKDPKAAAIDKIARGVCSKEKIAAELAEALYKNAIVKIETLRAEMNGFQSIGRYSQEVDKWTR